jgi:hypothetical protein
MINWWWLIYNLYYKLINVLRITPQEPIRPPNQSIESALNSHKNFNLKWKTQSINTQSTIKNEQNERTDTNHNLRKTAAIQNNHLTQKQNQIIRTKFQIRLRQQRPITNFLPHFEQH